MVLPRYHEPLTFREHFVSGGGRGPKAKALVRSRSDGFVSAREPPFWSQVKTSVRAIQGTAPRQRVVTHGLTSSCVTAKGDAIASARGPLIRRFS